MGQERSHPFYQPTALNTTYQRTYEESGRNGERFQNWIGRDVGEAMDETKKVGEDAVA
jgi:hypothetical protein